MINFHKLLLIDTLISFFLATYFFYVVIYKKNKFLNIFSKKKSELNMHTVPVAQNGGVIIIILFLINISINYFFFEKNYNLLNLELINRFYIIPISLIVLLLTSLIDFKYKLSPIIRLFVHIIVCYTSLALIKFPIISTDLVPLKIQFLVVLIFWVYLINTSNFIDGIDGMLTVNMLGLIACIFLAYYFIGFKNFQIFYFAIILTPLLISFLIFNFPKAKIFMGDTGSISLGYIVGYFLIILFSEKKYFIFATAFIYPIIDIGVTIIRKSINKTYPWARLFDYFFLLPVIVHGKKHTYVLYKLILFITLIILLNFFVIKYNLNNKLCFIIILIINIYLLGLFNKFRKPKS